MVHGSRLMVKGITGSWFKVNGSWFRVKGLPTVHGSRFTVKG